MRLCQGTLVPAIARESVRNQLIARLSEREFAIFAPRLSRVSLQRGETLFPPDAEIDTVHFPERAVVSIMGVVGGGAPIELGHAGTEGMAELAVIAGLDRSPYWEAVGPRGGTALCMSRDDFLDACAACPKARELFVGTALTFSVLMARTLVINLQHRFEVRLARWLLLLLDRLGHEGIELTHAYIAARHGVRRATVTEAMHALEGQGAIRNIPGRLILRDRAALEGCARNAYGTVERALRKRLSPLGERARAVEPAFAAPPLQPVLSPAQAAFS